MGMTSTAARARWELRETQRDPVAPVTSAARYVDMTAPRGATSTIASSPSTRPGTNRRLQRFRRRGGSPTGQRRPPTTTPPRRSSFRYRRASSPAISCLLPSSSAELPRSRHQAADAASERRPRNYVAAGHLLPHRESTPRPSLNTWTFSQARGAAGGIVAYSGVAAANPVDAVRTVSRMPARGRSPRPR